MSKIGRQPISIPQGVSVEISDGMVKVSGPKGFLERTLPPSVIVAREGMLLRVKGREGALWGTWRSHIANMVKGVTEGFEKKLEIHGVGYKAAIQGRTLTFSLGFSHPVMVEIPESLACELKENVIRVKGIDKAQVGQFAAYVRSLRPPNAYKGKGIRYQGEVVRLKPGKKAGVGVGA